MGNIFGFLAWAALLVAGFTGVIVDGNAGRIGWMAVDIIVFPVGVVRGILILLGVV